MELINTSLLEINIITCRGRNEEELVVFRVGWSSFRIQDGGLLYDVNGWNWNYDKVYEAWWDFKNQKWKKLERMHFDLYKLEVKLMIYSQDSR